jgi:hypothetical protein
LITRMFTVSDMNRTLSLFPAHHQTDGSDVLWI